MLMAKKQEIKNKSALNIEELVGKFQCGHPYLWESGIQHGYRYKKQKVNTSFGQGH